MQTALSGQMSESIAQISQLNQAQMAMKTDITKVLRLSFTQMQELSSKMDRVSNDMDAR